MKHELDWNEVRLGVQKCLSKIRGLMDDAEDVEQDAMLKAWANRDRYRGDAKPSVWGYSIARNAALDALKARKKEASLLTTIHVELSGHTSEDDRPYVHHIQDESAEDPYESVLMDEAWHIANAAYENFPERWLRNWIARDLHAKTYKQIAEERGIPNGTVRSSTSRTRHGMRPFIEELMLHAEPKQVQKVIRSALELLEDRLNGGSTRTE